MLEGMKKTELELDKTECIILLWIKNAQGKNGNEIADRLAKEAT